MVETLYKTYNDKLLAIVEIFKTWHYYLKNCQHKIFVFINNNNLYRFIDTKNLSFKLVYYTQNLS